MKDVICLDVMALESYKRIYEEPNTADINNNVEDNMDVFG